MNSGVKIGLQAAGVFTIVMCVIIPTIIIFGPELEAKLFPVIDIKAVGDTAERPGEMPPAPFVVRETFVDGGGKEHRNAICFRTDSVKYRPCVNDLVWTFHLDGKAYGAEVYWGDTGEVFVAKPTSKVFKPNLSRQLCADIPPVHYDDGQLLGNIYYTCHSFWKTQYDIPISLPPNPKPE